MQKAAPLRMRLLSVARRIPVLEFPSKLILGQPMAAVVVLELARTLYHVLESDPDTDHSQRRINDDVGRILMNALLRAVLESKGLEQERRPLEQYRQEPFDGRRKENLSRRIRIDEVIEYSNTVLRGQLSWRQELGRQRST